MLHSEQAPSLRPAGLQRVAVVSDSRRSATALERTAQLRLAEHSSVTVLQPVPLARSGDQREPSRRGEEGPLADAVRRVGGELHTFPLAQQGDLADAIAERAQAQDAELVVLGPEREGLRAHLFGSTAARLAGDGRVSVLVARQNAHRAYRHVLFATDLSDRSRAELELTLRMLPPEAALTVHHVYDTSYQLVLRQSTSSADRLLQFLEERRGDAERALERFLSPFLDLGRVIRAQVHSGAPAHEVPACANELGVDLVVVGTHGADPEHAVLGSVSTATIKRARCDVLVVATPPRLH